MEIETGTYEDWVDSIVWLVDSTDPVNGTQLDLRGIDFELTVRDSTAAHAVLIEASTSDGSLLTVNPPDYGYLIISLPASTMALIEPGNYVGDIVATDDFSTRVCVQFTLSLVQGVSRAASIGPNFIP